MARARTLLPSAFIPPSRYGRRRCSAVFCGAYATPYRAFMRTILCLILFFATVGLSHSAHGQATLTFSGGLGTPLTLTLSQPVTYTLTSSSDAFGPLFLFNGVGNLFAGSFPAVTGTITHSLNGASGTTFRNLNSGQTGNSLATNDVTASNNTALIDSFFVGQVYVLSAGTLTTTGNYAGNAPAGGVFTTYMTDVAGNRISSNGVSLVPEPSTWAWLTLAILSMGVARNLPCHLKRGVR